MLSLVLLGLLSTALSAPQVTPSSGPSGVATFNDYVKQGGSVCCPSNTPNNGPGSPFYTSNDGKNTNVYGAAAADISPDVGKGVCSPGLAQDTANCIADPNNPGMATSKSGYGGPACPTDSYCGAAKKCYSVTATGGLDGASIPGSSGFKPIVVQIIDVCPQNHAQNYCPVLGAPSAGIAAMDTPDNRKQHCESTSTNSMDIDINAYGALVGRPGTPQKQTSDPNLAITFQETPCPAGPTPNNCLGYQA